MAFLDNSGDIILDAVLTDTGRLRLARGDGSFKITKYAFGDDEVNYRLYDKTNTSGSAYYDLDILQMPVFEAFTNNTSVLKYPLLSISRTNLLYLPVLKINNTAKNNADITATVGAEPVNGSYVFVTNSDTITGTKQFNSNQLNSIIPSSNGKAIKVDQGIDSDIGLTDGDVGEVLTSSGLKETQYMLMMDNRLCTLVSPTSDTSVAPSFIDDDNVATYFVSLSSNSDIVFNIKTDINNTEDSQVLDGPRGTTLVFLLKSTTVLQTSLELFTKLGAEISNGTNTYYYIDTNIIAKGVTTGSSITIPVRFVRYKSTP
jgi:hypothetical protein